MAGSRPRRYRHQVGAEIPASILQQIAELCGHVRHTDQAVEDPRLVGIEELRLNLGHLRGERRGGRVGWLPAMSPAANNVASLILAGT
jgi:hypothetical protein